MAASIVLHDELGQPRSLLLAKLGQERCVGISTAGRRQSDHVSTNDGTTSFGSN
jgi:hypothetical protein